MKEFQVIAQFKDVPYLKLGSFIEEAIALPFVSQDVLIRYRWKQGVVHSATHCYEWRLDLLGHTYRFGNFHEADCVTMPMLLCVESPLGSLDWVLKVHDLGIYGSTK